jgi:hypothetical protein
VLLVGCASPDYVATRSNYDVCRLTMGGPHARAAEAEAANRGLNCLAYYPAIQSREAGQNAAIQQLLRPAPPAAPPLTCRTVRIGNSLETQCM